MNKRDREKEGFNGKFLKQEFRKCLLWCNGDTIKWYEMAREPDISSYFLFFL